MPKLSWTGWRFELTDINKDIAKHAGFHYDMTAKVFWTGLPVIAQIFAEYSDASAVTRLNAEQQVITSSYATDSNINIPCPDGLSYLPFQKGGIAYALPRRDTLIADEPGLGKTIQACGYINANPDIKKILVVPPAFLKPNWRLELMKWLVRKFEGGFVFGNYIPDTPLVICNYESFLRKQVREALNSRRFDLMIIDEAHYLKNPNAKRTKYILGQTWQGMRQEEPLDVGVRLFLTGTPILSRPYELWPIVQVADPQGLGSSEYSYIERYCKKGSSPYSETDGADNLDELQQRLRATIMVRRKKRDVLTELPPKRRQILPIPAEHSDNVTKAELEFYAKHEQLLEEATQEMLEWQAFGDEQSYNDAAKRLTPVKGKLFSELSKLRHETGLAMIPYATEWIKKRLEETEKLVIFAHHIDVVNKLYEEFNKISVFMHGGITDVFERQNRIDRFQKDPGVRIIIGSFGTMGVGYTLTESSDVICVEQTWVPAWLTQAEDRCHRIGQKESLLVQHLVFDNSLGASMIKRIVAKQEVIDAAIG